MIELESTIEGLTIKAKELEALLEPIGYSLGGNWDYDHGYYDYKLSEEDGYTFLRVPFKAIEGEVGSVSAIFQLGTPYLLHHVYQAENDESQISGFIPAAADGLINQFQKPVNKDAEVDSKYRMVAKNLLQELEHTLRP
ncbi:YugN-like family protein [Shouchella patagoniensis]|uniref:YugN-like family protein n=1 Tax=Shouchella patagoniensis TaxID=228576 RepID=UPI000994A80B|nr:YugN-like family protein [Shouchella patagoniensis]